ncbi:hypothetical protein NQ318_015857 [Aromia moschata]|uniref:Uncharacterized protein n=1 Tax=Aromia moschata TaxID=1265417 RepID=A0AAV8YPR0_9CUCU|nr:hypothetical protein NQ318_015857 [Aromia moschata]
MNYTPQIDSVFPHRFYLDNWTTQIQQDANPIVNGRLLWLGGPLGNHMIKYDAETMPGGEPLHDKEPFQRIIRKCLLTMIQKK